MPTPVTILLAFAPLILEPAIQAQYLTPYPVSFGVGIKVAEGILILLILALTAAFPRINSSRIEQDTQNA